MDTDTTARTYTLREAAERYGLELASLRKRADRGTLRTVKREGVRLVPHTELERLGLLPDARVLELEREVERLRGEIGHVRELEVSAGKALAAEREARERAHSAALQHRAEATAAAVRADELSLELERLERELAAVPWWAPWRARGIAARARREAEPELEPAG